MTALYDRAYSTNPGQPVARGTVLDCGHTLRAPDDGSALGRIGTGYAGDAARREVVCYPCAEDREAAAFAAADTFTAYDVPISPAWDRLHPDTAYHVTTWTGRELARVTHRWIGRGGFGSRMVYLRAVAPDGSRWYGRHSADWSEAVTLHRSKGNA